MTDRHASNLFSLDIEGDRFKLTIDCRLGAAPKILQSILNYVTLMAGTDEPGRLKLQEEIGQHLNQLQQQRGQANG